LLDQTLDLQAVKALCAFIENNFNLTGLQITQGELNGRDMKSIKEALLSNCCLQRFDLEFEKRIGAEGVREIAGFIQKLPNLKVLVLCELYCDK
jgi:hypothetical protein